MLNTDDLRQIADAIVADIAAATPEQVLAATAQLMAAHSMLRSAISEAENNQPT